MSRRYGHRRRCCRCRLMLLYHLVTVHVLWYAPDLWLALLVSAGRGARHFYGQPCLGSRSAPSRRLPSTPRISPSLLGYRFIG